MEVCGEPRGDAPRPAHGEDAEVFQYGPGTFRRVVRAEPAEFHRFPDGQAAVVVFTGKVCFHHAALIAHGGYGRAHIEENRVSGTDGAALLLGEDVVRGEGGVDV